MLLLHKALQRQPIATAGALAGATQLTPATINKTLAHLEKLGIVGRLNERRGEGCSPIGGMWNC